jgi:hypothetical protein
LVDQVLGAANPTKNGYTFTFSADSNSPASAYQVYANPQNLNQSGVRSFCSFEDGVVRYQASGGGLASCTSSVLPLQ